jgi:abequosyltransferase
VLFPAVVRFSICIPTHDGRRVQLEEALKSVVDQIRPDIGAEIEIVVSDNASADGTEEMMASFGAQNPGLQVVYARNERNLRLENIMRVVERASGEWCWLFGSDDVMAAGALEAVLAAIRAYPEAAGIAVARTNFDHTMQQRVQADPPEAAPPWHATTLIHGFAEIEDALAFQHGFMSANIVRRELWLAAAESTAAHALGRHPDWPHLLVFAEMARRQPHWVWLPTVLVLVRSGRPYLVESGAEQPNLARMHVLLVDGLRRAWQEIATNNAALRRRLMERTFHVAASRHAVENMKLSGGHGLGWDLRLAWSFARAFWWLGPFWNDVAPVLVVPASLYRARYLRRLRALRPMPMLAPSECSVMVSAELPARWWAREMERIPCRVRNTGTVALRTAGDQPIHLGGRWFGADGALVMETVRDPLPSSVEPGEEVEVIVRTHTPWDAGRYRLELGCVQENVRWFSDSNPANALFVDVDVHLPGPVDAGP